MDLGSGIVANKLLADLWTDLERRLRNRRSQQRNDRSGLSLHGGHSALKNAAAQAASTGMGDADFTAVAGGKDYRQAVGRHYHRDPTRTHHRVELVTLDQARRIERVTPPRAAAFTGTARTTATAARGARRA